MYPMDPGTRTLARSSFAVKVHIRRLFFSRAKSLKDKKFSSSAHIRRVHRLPQFLDNQCLVSQSPPEDEFANLDEGDLTIHQLSSQFQREYFSRLTDRRLLVRTARGRYKLITRSFAHSCGKMKTRVAFEIIVRSGKESILDS